MIVAHILHVKYGIEDTITYEYAEIIANLQSHYVLWYLKQPKSFVSLRDLRSRTD
jgi:hypothetical protein